MGPRPEYLAAASVLIASWGRPDLKDRVVELAYELQAAAESWLDSKAKPAKAR